MNKLDMVIVPFSSFQFVFNFSFNFSFSFKVQMCSYSCLQFSECGQVTSYRLKERDLFVEWFIWWFNLQQVKDFRENWEHLNGFDTWSTGVLCYLTGRIASLMEPVVNTLFLTVDSRA